jgi:hypothetical protein
MERRGGQVAAFLVESTCQGGGLLVAAFPFGIRPGFFVGVNQEHVFHDQQVSVKAFTWTLAARLVCFTSLASARKAEISVDIGWLVALM